MATRATKSAPAAPAVTFAPAVTPAVTPAPVAAPAVAASTTATPALDLDALVASVKVVEKMPTSSSLTGARRTENPFIPLIKASFAEGKARMMGPVPFLPVTATAEGDTTEPERIVNKAAMTRITNLIHNGAKALGLKAEIRKVAVENGINVYFTGVAKDAKPTTVAAT